MKIYIESTEDIIARIESFFEKEKEEVDIHRTLSGKEEREIRSLRNSIPKEDRVYKLQAIPLDDSLYSFQGFINYKNMMSLIDGGPDVYNKPIRVIKYGDKYVINDGNHRAALALFMGKKTIQANVLDLEV